MLTCALKAHDNNINIERTKAQPAFNAALILMQDLILSICSILDMLTLPNKKSGFGNGDVEEIWPYFTWFRDFL